MASRFFHIQDKDGGVFVKTRGVVGRVIPQKDQQGNVLKWHGYVGSSVVVRSNSQRGAAIGILKHLGIKESNLQGGRGGRGNFGGGGW